MDLEPTLKILGSVTALGGFIFGLCQYVKAQHWKRAEFAAKELDKLNSDHLLSMACTLLDWTERKFAIPDAYKYKAEEPTFIHNWAVLEKAMVPGLVPTDGRPGFSWQEVLYRDVFDHLFTYLDLVNHYIEIKLIKVDDVKILRYWLEQISHSELAGGRPIFRSYLKKFGYDGVNRLSQKLDVN
jgi:hypothetical protein